MQAPPDSQLYSPAPYTYADHPTQKPPLWSSDYDDMDISCAQSSAVSGSRTPSDGDRDTASMESVVADSYSRTENLCVVCKSSTLYQLSI